MPPRRAPWVSWRRCFGGSPSCVSLGLALTLAFFATLLLLNGSGGGVEEDRLLMERRLAELQSHLDHLRALDKEKSRAFVELRQQVNYLSTMNRTGEMRNGTRIMFFNNFSLTSNDLALPSIYDYLPHLLTKTPVGITPAIKIAPVPRRNVYTVIGIPTIKRPKIGYLMTTLRSLLENLSPEDKEDVLFVVMIAEVDGAESAFVQEQVAEIRGEFSSAIDSGLLEIIVPSATWYPPDLNSIPSTFDDPPDRMYWRTKQNLDYVYLMMYCQQRGRYYMQLEDDVVTKVGYMGKVREFIASRTDGTWLMLEFSSLGFISKLFRTADLPMLTEFLLMFYREKPVDWLLDLVFTVRYCNPEKSVKQCRQTINNHRIRLKPSLFQHIGVQSSLSGKVQKLKEKDFGKQPMHKPHLDNPPAKVSTSLKAYQKYTLENAYKGESFFWSLLPQAGDFVRFDFDPPIRLQGFIFRSGNQEHPADKFYNASVEVKYVADEQPAAPPSATEADAGFVHITTFTPSGTAQADFNSNRLVSALRLIVHSESENWLILNEIWIRFSG
uniref:Alpha-1,3-mannosyl-glycoprotein 4-beta-N-acetylglucosaminyltransferase A n=1 Tax=Plectus sambesii TaxID=2011161 RepID=A0A914X7M3_9BILA